MKNLAVVLAGTVVVFISAAHVCAQSPVPPPEPAGPVFAPAQLDQLVGPIALYPDPLIAEILPAATLPGEIVMADRYMGQGGDINLVAQQGWDPSVQALAHYPNVLKWMDDNLAWATQLGEAFGNQQADVMDAIQRMRAQAQQLGNLPSTPQETVVSEDGEIEIEPPDPNQMYVPDYDPNLIYYQPGVYCTFGWSLPLGIWLGHDWNWHDHGLIYWGPGHPRPGNWWHETPVQRHNYIIGHQAPVWHLRPGGVAVVRGGWDRGFETPRQSAVQVIMVHPAPSIRAPAPEAAVGRAPERAEIPVIRDHTANTVHAESAAGVFGGGQTGREARESSSRGQTSRATVEHAAPAAAAPHGGGGGGGGGGSHGGGGRH